jgi:deazaflavin-dependent oxidoreductase (nitroreductase family)
MRKLVGTGSRKGASAPSRAGDIARQPAVWIAFAAALSLTGPRGRRAALRGATCSAAASLIHLPLKRAFGRPRPRGAGRKAIGPLTSSFPSGHTASDLGFTFGAAQELPMLLMPLSVATMGSHWSLVRARKHYPSDVIAGGAIALAVNAAAWKLRPPQRTAERAICTPQPTVHGDQAPEPPHPRKRAVMKFVTNRLLNPIIRPLLIHGLWPRTQALIETTGRVTGRPRRVPVGNGLRDDSFWIVTEHGYGADYVKNIQHHPRIRVKIGQHWHTGTAHILPDDDPIARLRWLRRPVNDAFLLKIGTQQITIRVDLDS